MLGCVYSRSLSHASASLYTQTAKAQTTLYGKPMRSTYGHIHIELSSKHVLTVSLTMRKCEFASQVWRKYEKK